MTYIQIILELATFKTNYLNQVAQVANISSDEYFLFVG